MKLYIKNFADELFARTRKELRRDYDLDCAETVGVVEVKEGCRNIYATTMQAHRRNLADRAVRAYLDGQTSVED